MREMRKTRSLISRRNLLMLR